jgi:hypothetical protein
MLRGASRRFGDAAARDKAPPTRRVSMALLRCLILPPPTTESAKLRALRLELRVQLLARCGNEPIAPFA